MTASKDKESCPYCNRLMKVIDYTGGIETLTLSRSKSTIKSIQSVVKEIHVYSEVSKSQYYMLLNETQNIPGSIIRDAITNFIEKKQPERGRGVHYLMAIIKGDVTRVELTDKYEKKSLDRLPPLKE